METASAIFKVLSDVTRLRVAVLLAVHGEICVCTLAEALNEPECKISRHLAIMRSAGMVTARREGTWMHYRLAEPSHELERRLHDCLRDCLSNYEVAEADSSRLAVSTRVCAAGKSWGQEDAQQGCSTVQHCTYPIGRV